MRRQVPACRGSGYGIHGPSACIILCTQCDLVGIRADRQGVHCCRFTETDGIGGLHKAQRINPIHHPISKGRGVGCGIITDTVIDDQKKGSGFYEGNFILNIGVSLVIHGCLDVIKTFKNAGITVEKRVAVHKNPGSRIQSALDQNRIGQGTVVSGYRRNDIGIGHIR